MTGATIHAATGQPIAVAFDAGNLPEVAKIVCALFPGRRQFIAGDDDRTRTPNVGRLQAMKAAADTGACVVFPRFDDGQTDGTDFNDMAKAGSLEAVAEHIASVLTPSPHQRTSELEVQQISGRDDDRARQYRRMGSPK